MTVRRLVSLASVVAALAKYDPNQPRDENGRWVSGYFTPNGPAATPQVWVADQKAVAKILSQTGWPGTPEEFATAMSDGLAGTGLTADVRLYGTYSSLYYQATLYDKSGAEAGYMERVLYPARQSADKTIRVRHNEFMLRRDLHGKGIGSAVVRAQLGVYDRIGATKVHVRAGSAAGGYTWPRMGFTPTKEAWKAMLADLKVQAEHYGEGYFGSPEQIAQRPAAKALVKALRANQPQDIWKVADSTLGKSMLAGRQYDAELDMTDLPSVDRIMTYTDPKNKATTRKNIMEDESVYGPAPEVSQADLRARRAEMAARGVSREMLDVLYPLAARRKPTFKHLAEMFKNGDQPRLPKGQTGGGRYTFSRTTGVGTGFARGEDKVWRKADGTAAEQAWVERAKALRVPPGWTDVRLNPDEAGPLLATGVDAAGRRTGLYTKAFHESGAAKKFARVKQFNAIHTRLTEKAFADGLNGDDDAAALALVSTTGMRPGSDRNTGAKVQAYGATTLRARHVTLRRGGVTLTYTGKKGVARVVEINDPRVRRLLASRIGPNTPPDQRLFKTSDQKVRDYLTRNGGKGFKTKDFRTHLATSTALSLLKGARPAADAKAFQKERTRIGKIVAGLLGNTHTVALESYIDPTVWHHIDPNRHNGASP